MRSVGLSAAIWLAVAPGVFAAGSDGAQILYPSDGELRVNLTRPFQWTSVEGAQAYYLKIGTQPGGQDVVDTGEIARTEYYVSNVPADQDLWASVHTKFSTGWTRSMVRFRAVPALVSPANASVNVDPELPFRWVGDPDDKMGTTTYRLRLSLQSGGGELYDSGELRGVTSTTLPLGLPASSRIWATLTQNSTSKGIENRVSFFELGMRLMYPQHGDVSADLGTRTVQWTRVPVPGTRYRLSIGQVRDGSNLFDAYDIKETEFSLANLPLPLDQPLYMRVIASLPDGRVRRADGIFYVRGSALPSASLMYPARDGDSISTRSPIRWAGVELFQRYRLRITDTWGRVVHDSGEIRAKQRYVSDLKKGSYTAKLFYFYANKWHSQQVKFRVSETGTPYEEELKTAMATAVAVNAVAPFQLTTNVPVSWSLVNHWISGKKWESLCVDYADVLAEVLKQMNVGAAAGAAFRPRTFVTAFINNGYDAHALVEVYDGTRKRWVVVDPTLAVVVRRPDGTLASKEDIHDDLVTNRATGLRYEPFNNVGQRLLQAYYLDFPLLFANVPPFTDRTQDPLPYMEPLVALPRNQPGVYALRAGPEVIRVRINGNEEKSLRTDPKSHLTRMMSAHTIEILEAPGGVEVYSPKRLVFQQP